MHFNDLAILAERAWNETKPEGDPEWRSTALRHREMLCAAAQGVVVTGLAQTPFERVFKRLQNESSLAKGMQAYEVDALVGAPSVEEMQAASVPETAVETAFPEGIVLEVPTNRGGNVMEKNYHQTHTGFVTSKESEPTEKIVAPKVRSKAAPKVTKKPSRKSTTKGSK
jgi:hypothetical protein